MWIEFTTFWLPKAGNQIEEYEDAYSPISAVEGDYPEFRCAIADGATETSFSGLWAKILVDAFVDSRLNHFNQEVIQELSHNWDSHIAEQTREKPLSWYAEDKLRNGAFASLMGLHIKEDGWWSAICVGDSCLFQLRPSRGILSFPYTNPVQFNNRPILISTNTASNMQVVETIKRGKWKEGDCFFLMTDALAHYFMSNEYGKPQIIPSTLDQQKFESIIGDARQSKECRNDDVTLLKVCIKPGVSNVGMA